MPVYKGWRAKLKINGAEVGYATEVRVDIDHSLEYYFEAGDREPKRIIEGGFKITGHFQRAWVDTTYLSLLNNNSTLSTFSLEIYVNGMTLTINNCKFSKGTIAVPQDGILTEDYDFYATSCTIS